jgi:hypothetical protein
MVCLGWRHSSVVREEGSYAGDRTLHVIRRLAWRHSRRFPQTYNQAVPPQCMQGDDELAGWSDKSPVH